MVTASVLLASPRSNFPQFFLSRQGNYTHGVAEFFDRLFDIFDGANFYSRWRIPWPFFEVPANRFLLFFSMNLLFSADARFREDRGWLKHESPVSPFCGFCC